MVVLGIDPGSNVTGFGIINSNNTSHYECVHYGCIRLGNKKEFFVRLKEINNGIADIIDEYNPDFVALEDIFYSRNVKAAIQLGQARGAAVIAALNKDKNVSSYSPREVKQALTGNGGASKEQVQKMVEMILSLKQQNVPLDASDALAIAICHVNRYWTKKQMELA
jgi:crossover junction endodeoxyribonuclease RuvC